jgi:hypothetical protein
MKILAPACILYSIFWIPDLASAQAKPLKDLERLDIVIEGLEKPEKDMGLSVESLESQVLAALKRDLPNLKVEKSMGSYVSVRITSIELEFGYAVFASVGLYRPAKILRDKDKSEITHTLVSVWDKGIILTGPPDSMASRVRETISKEITELAADYHRQNGR